MSMEGAIAESEDVNVIDATLYSISKFMDGEKEIFTYEDNMEKQEEEYLTEPTPEDSTALGEVPPWLSTAQLIKPRLRLMLSRDCGR